MRSDDENVTMKVVCHTMNLLGLEITSLAEHLKFALQLRTCLIILLICNDNKHTTKQLKSNCASTYKAEE